MGKPTSLPVRDLKPEKKKKRASQPHDTSSTVPVVSHFTNNINSNETTVATTESEPLIKRQKQLLLSNRFGAPSELQIKAFYEAIVRMIAEDLQPLSIVENEGFKNMVNLLDSRYKIPSRRALGRTIIPNMYTNVRNKVQTLLNDTSYIAITTDIWTSINTDSFKTMTAHFFPKEQSKLKTVVLCTKKLEHSHTGAHLDEIMTSELNSWGILDKVVAIVTDGGSNIKSAVRLMDIQHIPCTAHKLNLVVQQALYLGEEHSAGEEINELHDSDKMKRILKKCRSILGFFKRSEVGNRILGEKQKQLGYTQILKLKQDVRTRWNSTLIMFERLVKLKEPLTIVMISLKEAPSNLTPEEWVIVEDIIPLLRPFNRVVPLIRGLQTSLCSKSPKTSVGRFIKSNLVTQVNRRFEGTEEQSPFPYFSRATLLDPRFKKAAFGVEQNASEAETAESSIISEIASLTHTTLDADIFYMIVNIKREVTTEQVEEDSENLWSFLQSRVNSVQGQTTSTSSAITLMKQYLHMSYQNLNCDVAEWWLSHKSVLHPLSEVALTYAMIPATSVPSERIFSKTGQLMSISNWFGDMSSVNLFIQLVWTWSMETH
ncbi:E3 SUMO-protein ligase ZBED1-like [Metopolophium dirhodum]|uniref:E3 SUMO-protein ligase ZBED1-like n=1 Tax=Metopolophium dirhodum TaxID=44670 RepID=UPI00298F9705|nr:E3 SUMO-protein ligase ZBED1-like [Metopolophium dirhodum]